MLQEQDSYARKVPNTKAWCGVPQEDFVMISKHVGAKTSKEKAFLFLLLAMARHTLSWECVFDLSKMTCKDDVYGYADESGLRKALTSYAKEIQHKAIRKESSRFRFELIGCPQVTHLVDCFPVRGRMASKHYNGKYHAKVYKYQGVTDLAGNFIEVRFVGTTKSDLNAFKDVGVPFVAVPGEVGLGDRAYVGLTTHSQVDGRCVTPLVIPPKETTAKDAARYDIPNNSAEMTTLDPAIRNLLPDSVKTFSTTISPERRQFGKYHQLVRSPIERAFSRLHKWSIMKFSPFEQPVTSALVHLIALADAHMKPQEATSFVRRLTMPRSIPPPKEDVHGEAVAAMMCESRRRAGTPGGLQGKNSKNRRKADLATKSDVLKMTKKQKDTFLREVKIATKAAPAVFSHETLDNFSQIMGELGFS